ncbi:MAG: hypothetical protein FJY83_03205 [Candidatus Aminicenantes bacterium]|nr:hypothetical protein [Candidatus Aminicenantes bacterium]
MTLTLNQVLAIVIVLAAVVAVTVFVILALQLRKTAAEAEKTLAEYRELAKGLQLLDQTLKDKLEVLGQTLEAARRTAVNVSGATFWLSSKVFKPASRWWPLLAPVLRFVWRKWKQRKEEHDV